MDDAITPKRFSEGEGVGDWRIVGDGACTFVPTRSFEEAVRLVQAIGQLAGIDRHRPDVDIRHDGVTIRLITIAEDYYGLSDRDVELARAISVAARDLGLSPDPDPVQSVLVIPGATDTSSVMPFWQAALGYVRRGDTPDEDLIDPHGRGPSFWFEQMKEPRPGGGGAIHIAVWVPAEHAQARVAAVLAAGGRMVRDEFAPAWWTLADAAGNEADIASITGRD